VELVIRNARLRTEDTTVDIGINGTDIEQIGPDIGDASEEIDANGGLVLPSFVESHTHLDLFRFEDVVSRPRETGEYDENVDRTIQGMEQLSFDEIKANATEMVTEYVAHGTTKIRTHVLASEQWGLDAVDAILDLKEELSHLVDVQTIVYPSPSRLGGERYEQTIEALDRGVDIVGGSPIEEDTEKLSKQFIGKYFDLAKEHDAGLDFHIDQTTDASARTLEYLARKTIQEGYQGRVQAAHACALASYDAEYRQQVIELLGRADINMNTAPAEDQLLPPLDSTSVRELLDTGVNLSIAHNDAINPWDPFGSMDQLEVAWLLVHALGLNSPTRWEQIFDCLTYNPAHALGLSEYGIEPGCRADLTVFREKSLQDVLRVRSPRPFVLKDGQVIARNNLTRTVEK